MTDDSNADLEAMLLAAGVGGPKGPKPSPDPKPKEKNPRSEPDSKEFDKHKFRIGDDFIEYYRDPDDSTKVFIPVKSLSKITLLSPDSAKVLMDDEG